MTPKTKDAPIQGTPDTPEKKAAYMACYWGQEIGRWTKCHSGKKDLKQIGESFLSFCDIKGGYLELTQLSDISDEHAFLIAKIRGFVNVTRVKFVFEGYWVTIKQEGKRSVSKFVFYRDMYQPEIDKLRELGYLTSWRDLSVEELFKRGWAKVKQKQ